MNTEVSSTMQTALVTGGSRGIGAAIAVELAARGFRVVINYRNNTEAAQTVANTIEQAGGQALLIKADVSKPDDVNTMFAQLDRDVGHLDVLVCNAGVTRDTLLGASEPDDFDTVFATNIHGVVNCCRQAAKRMASARCGVIITISSVAAQRPGRGQSNYAASKGAIEAFTKALAVELAPRGIRVNAVAPGVILTEMSADVRAMAAEEVTKKILLKRPGNAQEVAKVVGFLCSDEASYVTAQVWNVDGGFKVE